MVKREPSGSAWSIAVATRGAMLFDVVPIAVFIYGYFLLALRRFFCLGAFVSTAITLLFAAASYFVENTFHGLHGSVSYLPALGAMICFAALLWPRTRRRQTAAGHAVLYAPAVNCRNPVRTQPNSDRQRPGARPRRRTLPRQCKGTFRKEASAVSSFDCLRVPMVERVSPARRECRE